MIHVAEAEELGEPIRGMHRLLRRVADDHHVTASDWILCRSVVPDLRCAGLDRIAFYVQCGLGGQASQAHMETMMEEMARSEGGNGGQMVRDELTGLYAPEYWLHALAVRSNRLIGKFPSLSEWL